jgi:hypothetical protein
MGFKDLRNTSKQVLSEEVNIDKIIQDLGKSFDGSNEEQMKGVQLLKGLALSDDPKANAFMKKLDQATTKISKEMNGTQEESIDEASMSFSANEIAGLDRELKAIFYTILNNGGKATDSEIKNALSDHFRSEEIDRLLKSYTIGGALKMHNNEYTISANYGGGKGLKKHMNLLSRWRLK